MERTRLRVIVYIGISLALSAVLSMVKLVSLPQGGSVCLEALPIVVMAFLFGPKIGVLTGLLWGLLQLLIGPFIVHPAQLLLDYPLPYAALGLAGLWANRKYLGIILGFGIRLVFHVISGVVFFSEYAPEGTPVLTYSLIYNGSFLIPEAILVGVVGYWLWRRLVQNGIASLGA